MRYPTNNTGSHNENKIKRKEFPLENQKSLVEQDPELMALFRAVESDILYMLDETMTIIDANSKEEKLLHAKKVLEHINTF